MKKIIKTITILLTFIFSFTLFSCNGDSSSYYINYVSELRSDVFYGESGDIKLKAYYGYRENPYKLDGSINQKKYSLTLILLDKEGELQEYIATFSYNGDTYKERFKLNATSSNLTTEFGIENFNLKEFNIDVSVNGNITTVTLKSIVPESTKDYKSALNSLIEKQSDLLNSYYIDGVFSAEIILRITVRNSLSYWYVGICNKNGLKAFLMDGTTLEILAIREVV